MSPFNNKRGEVREVMELKMEEEMRDESTKSISDSVGHRTQDDPVPVFDSSKTKAKEIGARNDDKKHSYTKTATTNAAPTITTFSDNGTNPFFVPDLEYSKNEEDAVIRILDSRLFPWILLTTFVLNMDRTNNSNAISDNLPEDLGFSINVVNTATAIYSVLFSIFCLSGAVIAKIAGPSRCTTRVSCNLCESSELREFALIRDPDPHVLLGHRHRRARTHQR